MSIATTSFDKMIAAHLRSESVEATIIARDGSARTATLEVSVIADGEHEGEPVHILVAGDVAAVEFGGRRFELRRYWPHDYWSESRDS